MRAWYAVYTKACRESLAEEHLRRQGYEVYYPRIRELCRRRGRWELAIKPLFPRYLFVSVDRDDGSLAPVRSTRGVIDLVRFAGVPKILPHELIASIKAGEALGEGVHLGRSCLRAGDQVEIVEGPFAGLQGLLEAESGEERVIILLRLLGRDTRVAVERDVIVSA